MNTVLIWLPHRKCIVKVLIGHKYYVKHLNKKILKYFSRTSSTTKEPNFKILYNCIHELLNVFEDSAQREHTIILVLVGKESTTNIFRRSSIMELWQHS